MSDPFVERIIAKLYRTEPDPYEEQEQVSAADAERRRALSKAIKEHLENVAAEARHYLREVDRINREYDPARREGNYEQ